MIKLLLIFLVILTVSGLLIWRFSAVTNTKTTLPSPSPKTVVNSDTTNSDTSKETPQPQPEDNIPQTTTTDKNLLKKINDAEAKIKALEGNYAILKSQIGSLAQSPTPAASTQQTAPAKKSPVFIPVNISGGSVNSSDWTSLTSGTATINPADYPGYTTMNLIITLNVFQGNGRAFARIADSSNGNAITASETSTTSENATQMVSPAFTLPSSQTTYAIQLKTLTVGYPAIAGSSFIKVNF